MFEKLREHSKIIVYIAAIAMVATGAFMGFGAYMNKGNTNTGSNQPNIASVNGESIDQQEFLNTLQNQASQQPQASRNRVLEFRLNVLNSMIEREIILQEAEKMNINAEITNEELEETIDMILEQNDMSEEELKSNLEEQGYNMEQFREDIRMSLLNEEKIQKTVEEIQGDVSVSDEEIKEEYEEQNDGEEAAGDDFEEKKDEIKKQVEQEKKNEVFTQWMEEKRDKSEIEINDPSLEGIKALQEEDYDRAIARFREVKENSETTSASIYMHLAEALHGKGENDKALETYEEAVEEYPDDFNLQISFAKYYLENDNNEEALSQYDKASELVNPNDYMGYYQIYQGYQQLGEQEKAEEAMNKVIEIQQDMSEEKQPAPENETQDTEELNDQETEEIEDPLEPEDDDEELPVNN